MCEQTSSALPKALISRSALKAAAGSAVAAGGSIADLRFDAWGHGLVEVADAVAGAGAARMLVDTRDDVEMLARRGIAAATDIVADIDPAVLYGLAGGSTPALRLVGHVMSTKQLKPGDAVSYGYTFRAASDTVVALITGGYAQGIVRSLGNRAHVEIDGAARPIVGRVAMDVCVVDLQGADAALGAEATFFGGGGPVASELAVWSAVSGLSAAELLVVAADHAIREWEA